MTVRHDLENFQEGRDVILTLADSRILEEESGEAPVDTLVNVNMIDSEKAKKYIDDVKKSKSKSDYNPMDKFNQDGDPFEMGGKKLLKKYDEVLDEKHGQKSFQIGKDGAIDTTMVDIRRQMREDMAKNAISLRFVSIHLLFLYENLTSVPSSKLARTTTLKKRSKASKNESAKSKRREASNLWMIPWNDEISNSQLVQKITAQGKNKFAMTKWNSKFRAFRRGDNDPKKGTDVEMKEEVNEEKVEDKIKNDVVINSSLERTRRLLKSRTKVEAGTAIKQDPAAKLRDRLKKIKEMKEAKVCFIKHFILWPAFQHQYYVPKIVSTRDSQAFFFDIRLRTSMSRLNVKVA